MLPTDDASEKDDLSLDGTVSPVEPIAVRCFGTFEVRHGDRLLDPSVGERSTYKAWELLAFLAASPPGQYARDALLEWLWRERPINARRPANALNHAVSRLRKALKAQVPGLPGDVVRVGRDGTYRLDEQLVTSDVHRFLALVNVWKRLPLEEALDAHHEAFALYREEVLGGTGYVWVNEPPEGAKVLPALYAAMAHEFTLGLARRCVREGRHDRAEELYRRLLDEDPAREDLARELYSVYGVLGDRRALVRTHRALCQAMREGDDADVSDDAAEACEPDRETAETFRQVLEKLDAATSLQRASAGGRQIG